MTIKKRSFSMNLRDVENFFKYRRMPYPKRSAEFIALIAVSCTLFLFMHTKTLNSRLHEMEIKLQPSELSAIGLSASNSLQSGSDSKSDLKGVHGTYQYLKSTGQISHLNPIDLNNTRKAQMDIVFFNRVPKVGSETLIELMNRLAPVNEFDVYREKPPQVIMVTIGPIQQVKLAEDIIDLDPPAAYVHHVNFINFTQLELPRPIYINMVRDPVERVISWFYYARAPWVQAERRQRFPNAPERKASWFRKDFESCVLSGDIECNYIENSLIEHVHDHRRQSLFFCGHSKKDCIPFNSLRALQMAKRTVESEYAVVGLWNDVNVTLAVLEHYIPMFFKGATKIYHSESGGVAKNTNHLKPLVNDKIKEMVRKNFSREIEFYEFCRQRLHKQYIALKLDKSLNY